MNSIVQQKYLGKKGLLAYIILMNMFIPLTTDLYLPALPAMSTYFQCSTALTSFTLSIFFFFFATGMLVWGPLSDKYGRRPVILIGTVLYLVSTVACAIAFNIYFLIAARLLQGFGAGAVVTASTAIIKDSFQGKNRETILVATQSASGIAPMIAPVIGAFILQFTNWRGIFGILVGLGFLQLLFTLLYQDSLLKEDRSKGTLFDSWQRLLIVSKNKGFIFPVIIFSGSCIPLMGFIAVSSYIFINYFGLSEQTYSFYFASNAMFAIIGPIIYLRFFTGFNKKLFPLICFGIASAAGLCAIIFGSASPLFCIMSIILMSITTSMMRPYGTYIFFDQQKGDSGSVSSVFNTTFTVLGSIGMVIASLGWSNPVAALGTMITVCSVAAFLGWAAFLKSKIPCIGVK